MSSEFKAVTSMRRRLAVNKLFAIPPTISTEYGTSEYQRFMREETFLYTPRYAQKAVVIHDGIRLSEIAKHHGAILAPVHYGSFFLSSGAIVHQLNMACTNVVTSANLDVLPVDEADFWRGVHRRSADLYRQPLFYSGVSSPRQIMRYLAEPGNLLLAMLDVREQKNLVKEYPFQFLQGQLYLQVGPARLACLCGVPLVPMCIQYNPEERKHHLYFGAPVWPNDDPVEMTQQALTQLEKYIEQEPRQLFHDLINAFAVPHHSTASCESA